MIANMILADVWTGDLSPCTPDYLAQHGLTALFLAGQHMVVLSWADEAQEGLATQKEQPVSEGRRDI